MMSKLESRNTDPKIVDPKMPDPKSAPAGRFAYDGLDRVIHEKARLSVLTSLVAHPKGLVFGDLKQMCGLTDGNLSRHLQVLDEAGLIAIEKGYDHNRPQTVCRITAQGRRRYLDYLKVLEQVVQDAASAAKAGEGRGVAAVGQRRLKLA
jgi:DNA-binding MarR family transcriptional regulator